VHPLVNKYKFDNIKMHGTNVKNTINFVTSNRITGNRCVFICLPSKPVCVNIISIYKYISDGVKFGSQLCNFETLPESRYERPR